MSEHVVYRLYADMEQSWLLYIGVTGSLPHRLKQHRREQPWWDEVSSLTTETFPSRRLALEAELSAIHSERPPHNVMANGRRHGSPRAIPRRSPRARPKYGYSPMEEAQAVDRLVDECGSAAKAAAMLGRSAGWVSQRRGLLRLSPAMQQALNRGELTIADARRLAALPPEDQERAERMAASPEAPGEVWISADGSMEDVAAKMAKVFPREHLAAVVPSSWPGWLRGWGRGRVWLTDIHLMVCDTMRT